MFEQLVHQPEHRVKILIVPMSTPTQRCVALLLQLVDEFLIFVTDALPLDEKVDESLGRVGGFVAHVRDKDGFRFLGTRTEALQ